MTYGSFGPLPIVPEQMGKWCESAIYREFLKKWGEPVGVYPYFSHSNTSLISFYIIVWNTKTGKVVRPLCAEGNLQRGILRWASAFPPGLRPVFNAPRLLDPNEAHRTILVVEGEKTALAASEIFPDWTVITSSGGANGACNTEWPLQNRKVVIACDYDEPGLAYGDEVAKIAAYAGAQSTKELRWSPLAQWRVEGGGLVPDVRETCDPSRYWPRDTMSPPSPRAWSYHIPRRGCFHLIEKLPALFSPRRWLATKYSPFLLRVPPGNQKLSNVQIPCGSRSSSRSHTSAEWTVQTYI